MSNRTLRSGAVAAAFVMALFAGAAARAADLGGYFAAQEDKAEFGSGWYIRGDLAATGQPKLGISDVPAFNAANPGSNPSAPGLLLNGSNVLGYDASVGAGYRFNRWFRADLVGDFHEPLSAYGTGATRLCTVGFTGTPLNTPPYTGENAVSANCTPTNLARLNSYDVLLNGYIDLGTWYGVTPYVGAGLGLSFGHFATSSQWYEPNGTSYTPSFSDAVNTSVVYNPNFNRSTSGLYYNFAWAAMGGVAIDIYDHTKLDIGYRYLDLGKINAGATSINLKSQEVRAGLRYMIDN